MKKINHVTIMTRLLLALTITCTSFCSVYIRTPVLAVVDHKSVEKEIFEWGRYYNGRPVTSICSGSGQRYDFRWCVSLMKYIKWHTSKEYFVYILRYGDNKTDSLIVTGDQKFQLKDNDDPSEWIDTSWIYSLSENSPTSKIELARFPESIKNEPYEDRWAEVISIVKIIPQDNHELEFFDVSVDDTHTFFIGKSQVWTHNMAIAMRAAWAFGGQLCQRMAFAPIQYQADLDRMRFSFDVPENRPERTIPKPSLEKGHIVYKDEGGSGLPVISMGGSSSSGGGKNGTDPDRDPGRYLRKAIRSYEEQLDSHRKKIEDDRAGKNLPDDLPPELREIVRKGQENHHQKEIEAFIKGIADANEKLIKMGLKP